MKRSHYSRTVLGFAALALTVAAIGCTNDPTPTAPVEDPVDVPRITETFTGSFGQRGQSRNEFTVAVQGNVEMTITSLQPVPTLTVGMSIGNFDATMDPMCNVFASDNRVVVGARLVSAQAPPGEYCVIVGDVGNVFPDSTVTYTVDVLHP